MKPPAHCERTCANIAECEDGCIGYVPKDDGTRHSTSKMSIAYRKAHGIPLTRKQVKAEMQRRKP